MWAETGTLSPLVMPVGNKDHALGGHRILISRPIVPFSPMTVALCSMISPLFWLS
jgi:hypothetical protein